VRCAPRSTQWLRPNLEQWPGIPAARSGAVAQRHLVLSVRPGSQLHGIPVGPSSPPTSTEIGLHRQLAKAFVLGEAGTCCAGSLPREPCVNQASGFGLPRHVESAPLGFAHADSPAAPMALPRLLPENAQYFEHPSRTSRYERDERQYAVTTWTRGPFPLERDLPCLRLSPGPRH